MQFQLVLQFAGHTCPALDDLVALEDELAGHIPTNAVVDGHDIGSGEANIFILTSDPTLTFSALIPILRERGRLEGMRAAYRPEASENYVNLWPEGWAGPFNVR